MSPFPPTPPEWRGTWSPAHALLQSAENRVRLPVGICLSQGDRPYLKQDVFEYGRLGWD